MGKKLTDALTQIKIALALNSGEISYYNNKVQIEYELGNYKEVLNDCKKAYDISKSFDERDVFLQMAILSKLELYELNSQINATSFDGIYNELEEIYKNESGDKKFFNRGMKIFVDTKDTYENLKELAFWLSLFEFITDKIKSELVVRDLTCEIAYYTKMKNLYNILNDEKDEVKYRLPLFDVDYMNDPNEGVALSRLIFSKTTNFYYKDFCKDSGNEPGQLGFNKSYTFLKSFSKVVDTLPMWTQYGDNGKGCCIKINPKLFTNLNYQSKASEKFFEALPFKDDYRLYTVAYIENQMVLDGNHSSINKLLKRQIAILDQIGLLIKNWEKEERRKVVNAINEILSDIKYLFKDSTYSHEQEVRIIIHRSAGDIGNPKCDIDIKYKEHNAFIPKIYTCLAKSTMISEIILGPRVFNANDHIPYISMQLQKLKDLDDSTAIITKSSIDYR